MCIKKTFYTNKKQITYFSIFKEQHHIKFGDRAPNIKNVLQFVKSIF